jgi:hypothetical protein
MLLDRWFLTFEVSAGVKQFNGLDIALHATRLQILKYAKTTNQRYVKHINVYCILSNTINIDVFDVPFICCRIITNTSGCPPSN